jgi:phage-related protein
MSAQFQFTIPAAITGGSDQVVTADRGLSRNTVPRVLVARFGDGYEQRVADGVNAKDQTFMITFNNRAAADIYNIEKFFNENTGKAFTFTVADKAGNTAQKVVCEDYNITYISENFHSITANLRRVYEP